nr:MAG TPA: hypothetical protein [Bacteriophage sp.]
MFLHKHIPYRKHRYLIVAVLLLCKEVIYEILYE